MRTQEETASSRHRGRPQREPACPRLDPGLPASQTGENEVLAFKPPACRALFWGRSGFKRGSPDRVALPWVLSGHLSSWRCGLRGGDNPELLEQLWSSSAAGSSAPRSL